MKFDDLELSDPILRSLQNQKYKEPTPIQSKVIPEIANGKDVMAAAQTGTGKTAAFVLPILNKLTHPKEKFKGHRLRALIVTPTRELAIQVRENINTYSKYIIIIIFNTSKSTFMLYIWAKPTIICCYHFSRFWVESYISW